LNNLYGISRPFLCTVNVVLAQAADRTNTQVYCVITIFIGFIDTHSHCLYTDSDECKDVIQYCEYFTEFKAELFVIVISYGSGASVVWIISDYG